MAPPIPGRRPAVTIRHRTPGDVLAGVAAVLALTALTIGVPIALITVIGLPWPHTMPGVSALTSQLDISSILRILSVVIWLAWIQLVWCVLVEIKAAVSNVGVPSRVPLAGPAQPAAHRLVTAALLLFTAAAALAPAVHHATPPRPAPSISAQVTPGPELATQTAPAHTAPNAEKAYMVKPPVGRFHESLWEIAHNHLGDGRRYREVFELNKDRIQPDGTKLTIASLIRPGWVLLMPKDAHGPGIEAVTPKLAGTLGLDSHPSAGQVVDAGWGGAGTSTSGAPSGELPDTALPGGIVRDNGIFAGPQSAAHQAPAWPNELSAATLLAAGVLVALGRRRREQLWRRAFGRRIAGPDPEAALAEEALRLGADDPAVRMLDTGLRYLSVRLAAQDRTPPTVFAAHLGQENLDLWIAPPDPNPPRPWQAADGGQVWRLARAAASGLEVAEAPDPAGGGTLAPYPGLVSLGTNSAGRVLVDLEVAHGLIAVRGPRPVVQAALSALAVELVTNRWSDRMRVTLVGFGDGLAELAPERVRVVRTLDEALPELEVHAAQVRDALAAAGLESVLTGRSRTADERAWAPRYLIMGVPPTLGPGVRVDWQVFRALFARASQAAAASDASAEAGYLQRALALVRGQFLDGRDQSRYAWLAADDAEYEVTAAVADAAHRLATLTLAAGDPDASMAAARAGLRLAFNDELLWRDLLTGAHATGQEHVLRAAVSEISARVALDEVMPRMAPETEALIDELLPSWRTSAA